MSQVNKIINETKKRRESTKKEKKENISIPPKRKGRQRENKNKGIEVYNKLSAEDSSTKNELLNLMDFSTPLKFKILACPRSILI